MSTSLPIPPYGGSVDVSIAMTTPGSAWSRRSSSAKNESEQEGSQHRQREAEQEHRDVQCDDGFTRDEAVRRERHHQLDAAVRKERPDQRTAARAPEAFDRRTL